MSTNILESIYNSSACQPVQLLAAVIRWHYSFWLLLAYLHTVFRLWERLHTKSPHYTHCCKQLCYIHHSLSMTSQPQQRYYIIKQLTDE